ncbi:hypothetical protein [Candidatus Electronema sp. JM]|uniref:hypothetical protein n=1 Tax=Candidatus Electronema sp. JM TaxID=3401571 RepID=UPI003AA7D24D
MDSFCDLIEEREGKAQAEQMDEAMHELADDEVLPRLLAEADKLGRRLLLLIDNVDLILERLKKEEPELRLLLIGASTQPVDADFFRAIDQLAGLSLLKMQAMLTRLAEQELAQKKTPEPPAAEHPVLVLLRDDPARIKTLHTLTGGNLLLTTLLFNVFSSEITGDVWSDLEELVDLVITPEYKAKLEELSTQAQQLFDGLASN